MPPRRPRPDQGPGRRVARLPQELPDDDLRLLRDADGRPGRPRLQGAHEADRRERPRARDLGDGEHARPQGPRRRHVALLDEDQEHEALARDGLRGDPGEGVHPLPGGDEPHPQGSALHHVRLLRLRVQLDGVRSRVLRAGRAREGLPLRRRPARPDEGRAARGLQRRARDLGLHALLFLQRALPQGRRPTRRDREARRRVDRGRDRPRHGREARELVRPLRAHDRLAARDRARAQDAGRRLRHPADEVCALARQARQGAASVPAARGGERAGGQSALRRREDARGQGRGRHRPGRARARTHRAHRTTDEEKSEE